MRFIDEATVARVLRMQDLIPVMRQTMILRKAVGVTHQGQSMQ